MANTSPSNEFKKRLGISKILWVEDVEEDAIMAEWTLKKEGFVFVSKRVFTREDFVEALHSFKPDVVLSDHNLPQFNSLEAFNLFQREGFTVPFILVTGMVSEEFAVSCLKLGMDDYVLKTNLSRLPSAILNALHQRDVEGQRKIKDEEIRLQNEKLGEAVRYRTQELVNEKHFSELIIKSMPGIFHVISNNRFIRWNKNMENVLGYSSEELGSMNIQDIIADKDKEKAAGQVQKILLEGSASPELSFLTKDGRQIFYYLNAFRARINEKDLIVVTGQDITELKNAQEVIQLSEERLDLAFTSSGYAWWDWDIVTGGMDTHPNRYLVLGYLQSDVTPSVEWWGSLLHPDDLEKVKNTMDGCLSGKTSIYNVQYRLRSKSGEWKWLHDLGKVVTKGDQGQPLRMIGTANDISDSKLIEQELTKAKYNAESATGRKVNSWQTCHTRFERPSMQL